MWSESSHRVAQFVAIIIVMVSVVVMPGVGEVSTVVSFTCVWILVQYVYGKMQWRTGAGWVVLLVVMTLTSAGIVANVHGYTVLNGATTGEPYLFNTDQHRYFYNAVILVNGGDISEVGYQAGYSYIIRFLWFFTGQSIVPVLVLNQVAMMGTLLCVGYLTDKIIDKKYSFAPTVSIILCSSVCYLLNHATLPLKESLCTFILAFTASFVAKNRNTTSLADFIVLVFAALAFGLLRFTFIPYLAILFVALKRWNLKSVAVSALVLIVFVAFYVYYDINVVRAAVTGEELDSTYTSVEQANRGVYWSFVSDYMGPFGKLALLPISAVVQLVTPFPWNFERDMVYGLTQWYSHVSYFWYAVACLMSYYVFTDLWRSTSGTGLRCLTVVGLFLWFVPAYLFAGSVSRYALPAVPLLIPCATYVIVNREYRKRSFKIFGLMYALCLVVLLTIVFIKTEM